MRRRSYRHGGGSVGQQTDFEAHWTSVLDPRVDIPARYGAPLVLWVGGDGINPTIGPTLTKVGTPVVADGPHVGADGVRLQEELMDGAACYTCATSIDPAAGEDFVIFLQFRAHRLELASTRHLFATRVTGNGLQVYVFTSSPNPIYTYAKGDTIEVASAGTVDYGGRYTYVAVANRDGNMRHWLNGIEGTPFAMPTGTIGTGLGFSIGGRTDGASRVECGLEVFSYWKGPGIADRWTDGSAELVQDLHWRSTVGDFDRWGGSFTRGSAASWLDTEGRWHIGATGYPRAGDVAGIRLEGAVTNLCARNRNPQDAAEITVTGAAVKSVVNAAADLLTAKADAWGPNVYRVVNATGSTQYVYASGIVGALTVFSAQAIARIVAGSGARLGLYDVPTGTFTDGAAIGAFAARTLAPGMTPANVDQRWAIAIPNGCTVDFIGHQLESGERCMMPMPNNNTGGATVTKSADVLDTGIDLRDEGGSVAMSMIPLGWSDQPAATNAVDCLGSVDLCTIRGATGRFRIWDQVNIAESPAGETKPWSDGVAVDCRHSWGRRLFVNCDGEQDVDLYDGTLPAGTLTLGRSAGVYAMAVPRFLVQRYYSEAPCP